MFSVSATVNNLHFYNSENIEMKEQQEIEQKLKTLKPILSKKFNVNRLGYFGSFATGNATEASDIDILVDFDKPIGWDFFDLQDFLFENLNRKIDLVSIKALKPQLEHNILNQVIFV